MIGTLWFILFLIAVYYHAWFAVFLLIIGGLILAALFRPPGC